MIPFGKYGNISSTPFNATTRTFDNILYSTNVGLAGDEPDSVGRHPAEHHTASWKKQPEIDISRDHSKGKQAHTAVFSLSRRWTDGIEAPPRHSAHPRSIDD
jgi:hypothetical protein